jgi:hypothetical protein
VVSRYQAGPVVLFDTIGNYRLSNMNEHVDFLEYYDSAISNYKPARPLHWLNRCRLLRIPSLDRD